MTYEPPPNASLWQAVLADEDRFVTTAAEALDEFGPESHVEVSIRRLSALPVPQTFGAVDGVWRLPGSSEHGDIAAEWTLDIVDDIGETDHITAQLNTARAMAAGLNGALANVGDWNRSTELAAALHDLADKLAAYTGSLPDSTYGWTSLYFRFDAPTERENGALTAQADQLAEALLGEIGTTQETYSGSLRHEVKQHRGGLRVDVWCDLPKDDPAVLRARIVELEAQLAGGAA